MPILNNAKGVYRGSALVAFVRVAGRVIWQARKIVGWEKIAGPVMITDTSSSQKRLDFTDRDSVSALQVLSQYTDIGVGKPGGEIIEVVDKEISGSKVRVFLPGKPKDYGLNPRNSVEFYQPVGGLEGVHHVRRSRDAPVGGHRPGALYHRDPAGVPDGGDDSVPVGVGYGDGEPNGPRG